MLDNKAQSSQPVCQIDGETYLKFAFPFSLSNCFDRDAIANGLGDVSI